MIPPNRAKIKARAAVAIKAIGVPLNGLGIGACSIASLNPEKMYKTNKKPTDENNEKTNIEAKSYSYAITSDATPKTAQLVVISGR